MKKQLIIIGIIVLILSVGLSGCNQVANTLNPDKNKFIGTWHFRYEQFNSSVTFLSDGTFSASDMSITFAPTGSWDIKDNKLVIDWIITGSGQMVKIIYDYFFSDNNNNVTLTNVNTGNIVNMTTKIIPYDTPNTSLTIVNCSRPIFEKAYDYDSSKKYYFSYVYVKIENTGDVPFTIYLFDIDIKINELDVGGYSQAIANLTFIPGEVMTFPELAQNQFGTPFKFKNEISGTIEPNESKVFICYLGSTSIGHFDEGRTYIMNIKVSREYPSNLSSETPFSTTITIP